MSAGTPQEDAAVVREALLDARDWVSDEWDTNPFAARFIEELTDAVAALDRLEQRLARRTALREGSA